jgi:glycosyltransferase involved in cell wall biosynthesis
MAWKRGWLVFYEPRSIVFHDHRGTISKTFSDGYIQSVVERNQLLFLWKNIHEKGRLAAHLFWLYAGFWIRLLSGPAPMRPGVRSMLRAVKTSGLLLRARRRAKQLSVIDDTEAFRRPLGGYFRDRFGSIDAGRDKLNVLFVSPYPIEPPLHGGAVFMNQTVRHLARMCNLHLLCFLDDVSDFETNQQLALVCASSEFVVRSSSSGRSIGGLQPHAAETFHDEEFRWRIHRSILLHDIDVIQLEYTQLAGYREDFRGIASALFEHDIYFQSVQRALRRVSGFKEWIEHVYEYLRALRFELRAIEGFDSVQVCTPENRRYLESFLSRRELIQDGLRAGIDVGRYSYSEPGREPESLLFVGNLRHTPNRQALEYFIAEILPLVRQARPSARLTVVGAHVPAGFEAKLSSPGVAFAGHVEDIRRPLAEHAVFVCPILSGSGVRVKLLEAFAAGIPVVSTPLGAEGLLDHGSDFLWVAESANNFAAAICNLLSDPARAAEIARRARRQVEEHWDVRTITRRLEQHYREILRRKLSSDQGQGEAALRWPPGAVQVAVSSGDPGDG